MNPEEGELRPQLLDRFSLHISIHELLNEKQRIEIVKNNLREKQGRHFRILSKGELMDFPFKSIWNVYFYHCIRPSLP
jgi:hypothetical protein